MPWRYAFIHFIASLFLGSFLVVLIAAAAINIAQGTLYFDGIGLLGLFTLLYSFILSIPGIGHLNLYYSRQVDQMDFDLFWVKFRLRYLLTTSLYVLSTSLLVFLLVGRDYPNFQWVHIVYSLVMIGTVVGTYAAVGWYILKKLKGRLRAAR